MANKYTKQVVDLERAKELYGSGMTQKEVAVKLGTTQKVIYMRFKEIGYKCRVAKKRNQLGENNPNWKGNKADYKALHRRVEEIRGKPNKCEECETTKTKRYEWANISGNYSDVMDYKRLCKKCHHKFDKEEFKRDGKGKFK